MAKTIPSPTGLHCQSKRACQSVCLHVWLSVCLSVCHSGIIKNLNFVALNIPKSQIILCFALFVPLWLCLCLSISLLLPLSLFLLLFSSLSLPLSPRLLCCLWTTHKERGCHNGYDNCIAYFSAVAKSFDAIFEGIYFCPSVWPRLGLAWAWATRLFSSCGKFGFYWQAGSQLPDVTFGLPALPALPAPPTRAALSIKIGQT